MAFAAAAAAAAARRAQGGIRPWTIAPARTPQTARREISAAAAAARRAQGVIRASSTALLRSPLTSRWMSSVPDPTPQDLKLAEIAKLSKMLAEAVEGTSAAKTAPPKECSIAMVKDLKAKVSDLEKQMVVLQVGLRHTQAAYWSSFFGFTTVLSVLPAWVYYIQLNSSSTKKDVEKLEQQMEKIVAEQSSKISKVELEVKFPPQDS